MITEGFAKIEKMDHMDMSIDERNNEDHVNGMDKG